MAAAFQKFVVIVAYGRSGSTLLQTVLQTIPGSFIRGENNNVLYPLFRAWKRAHATRYSQGPKAIPAFGPWYGADEIAPRRFVKRLIDAVIEEILIPPQDTRVLGFKEIRFHDTEEGELPEFLDFIRRELAPCKIVFNTRRVDDVARSAWWKEGDAEEITTMLERLDRQYADYAAAHPGDCFLVRYDEYTRDREALRPLFDFLDEPFDGNRIAAVLDHRLKH